MTKSPMTVAANGFAQNCLGSKIGRRDCAKWRQFRAANRHMTRNPGVKAIQFSPFDKTLLVTYVEEATRKASPSFFEIPYEAHTGL